MSRCPTPDKEAYADKQAAVFFARTDGLRVYKCRCGSWHLSSMPKAGQPMGVARRRHA